MGQPVSVNFIERLQCPHRVQTVTKLVDKIYVLCGKELSISDTGPGIIISIFMDRSPFQVYRNIQMSEILYCQRVVSCDKLKCLYISDDSRKRCIWKLTVDDYQVTQWLTIVDELITLSISSDGRPFLVLTDDKRLSRLEIYGSDAKIIRSISLSRGILSPRQIIQEPNGQFIIIHKMKESLSESWVMSKLSSEGQILCQYEPREKIQELMNPSALFLDLENNRLFLTQMDAFEFSVVMFDLGSLEWKQILLDFKVLSPIWKLSVHYDERNKQLLVGKSDEVNVYQIY